MAIAGLAAQILIPLILGKLAGVAADAHASSYAKANPAPTPAFPANAIPVPGSQNLYNMPTASGRLGARTFVAPMGPAPAPYKAPLGIKALGGAGKLAGGVGSAAYVLLPLLLNMLGRSTQAAGATAGAAAQAAGNIPKHIAGLTSNQQRELYGGTIFDVLGGISSDAGAAAGVGLTGAGDAVGGALQDASKMLQVKQVADRTVGLVNNIGKNIQNSGLSPSAMQLAGQTLNAGTNMSRLAQRGVT